MVKTRETVIKLTLLQLLLKAGGEDGRGGGVLTASQDLNNKVSHPTWTFKKYCVQISAHRDFLSSAEIALKLQSVA